MNYILDNVTNLSALDWSIMYPDSPVTKCVQVFNYSCPCEHLRMIIVILLFLVLFLVQEIIRNKYGKDWFRKILNK